MNFIDVLHNEIERSSPGSEETAKTVCEMLKGNSYANAVFIGDDCYTPLIIKEKFGCAVKAAYSEDFRMESAAKLNIDAVRVQHFEIPESENGRDLLWYNGAVEFDGIERRLEQLHEKVNKGKTVIYRALCWISEPSPDTVSYCTRRFGIIKPLDRVLLCAKERGFKVIDFYISPKSDWTGNYYVPLMNAACRYAKIHPQENSLNAGMGEIKKEVDIFNMHCEEYSYVYYVLKG